MRTPLNELGTRNQEYMKYRLSMQEASDIDYMLKRAIENNDTIECCGWFLSIEDYISLLPDDFELPEEFEDINLKVTRVTAIIDTMNERELEVWGFSKMHGGGWIINFNKLDGILEYKTVKMRYNSIKKEWEEGWLNWVEKQQDKALEEVKRESNYTCCCDPVKPIITPLDEVDELVIDRIKDLIESNHSFLYDTFKRMRRNNDKAGSFYGCNISWDDILSLIPYDMIPEDLLTINRIIMHFKSLTPKLTQITKSEDGKTIFEFDNDWNFVISDKDLYDILQKYFVTL